MNLGPRHRTGPPLRLSVGRPLVPDAFASPAWRSQFWRRTACTRTAGIAIAEKRTSSSRPSAAKVAALEAAAPKPKAQKPLDDEGVRIIELPPSCGAFIKPSDAELLRLQEIVLGRYPVLRPELSGLHGNREEVAVEFHRQFRAAFIGIAPITRIDEIDYSKFPTFWIDESKINARAAGDHTSISLFPFLAAIGGGSGIRTRDRVSPIHTFQACAFNHSATPPEE